MVSGILLLDGLHGGGERVGISLQVGVSGDGNFLLLQGSSHHELLQGLKKRSLLSHDGAVVDIKREEVDDLRNKTAKSNEKNKSVRQASSEME